MGKVIAAARTDKEFELAINSSAGIVFQLAPNIETLGEQARLAHENGKKLFVHIDLAEGIGKDEYGIRYAKKQGVDGIISTRNSVIKLAKKVGMYTVQRFFVVDSQSVETTVESAKASATDMVEIMPGIVPKIISRLKTRLGVPIVAGGLIETKNEVLIAVKSGASAVSTGNTELWK